MGHFRPFRSIRMMSALPPKRPFAAWQRNDVLCLRRGAVRNQMPLCAMLRRRSENVMCLVACLAMWLTPILASVAPADAQAPSNPQAYCVNRNADFYPYTGEPCKGGYQLGSGNCRKTDGRLVALTREQCIAAAGTIELPVEGGIRPQAPKSLK